MVRCKRLCICKLRDKAGYWGLSNLYLKDLLQRTTAVARVARSAGLFTGWISSSKMIDCVSASAALAGEIFALQGP